MHTLFWIAAATFFLTFLAALDLLRGNRSVRALRNVSPLPYPGLPRVSIIVAARNEHRNIREALLFTNAVFITRGAVQVIYLTSVALILLIVADCARFHHSRPWYAIGYPLMSALFVFILLRTMLLNLWQGGIRWRGTFYSLKELKANRI